MNFELLKQLCETPGIPGNENGIRTLIEAKAKEIADSTSVDAMGNLILYKEGKGKKDRKKIMIAAHMDEIGFVVKYIDDKGFIRLHNLGGFDPRTLFAQRVKVTTKNGVFQGALSYSSKPIHMMSDSEKNASPQLDNFFVDLGLNADEVKKNVEIGDMITMERTCEQVGERILSKTLDDRVGVYCMLEAVKAAGQVDADIYAVATVQEEVGLRGAATSSYALKPDVSIALDITLANDYPGPSDADCVTKLDAGVGIKLLDGSLICNPKLVAHFKEIAKSKEIPYQMEILTRGGTDAGAMQRSRGGVPAITLSVPTRYVHTVNEMASIKDIDATVQLLSEYLKEAQKGDYSF